MLFIRWVCVYLPAFYHRSINEAVRGFSTVFFKLSACVFLLLLSINVAAQQTESVTTVTGQVIDAVSGKPLMYVNVKVNGSTYTVSTDSAGKFSLSKPGVFSKVTFSCIGYQPVVKAIKPGRLNELHISMRGSQNQLKEVVITSKKQRYRNKDNPAVALIQQIINHKNENRMESAAYLQYQQYERIGLSVFNLPQKFINGKFFSKYRFMLDSTTDVNGQKQTLVPVLLNEKLSDVYYRKQPEKNIQVLQAEKSVNAIKFIDTAGLHVYLNQLYGNNLDIYENNIFIISNQFLSPIADHSPNYYKFFIKK